MGSRHDNPYPIALPGTSHANQLNQADLTAMENKLNSVSLYIAPTRRGDNLNSIILQNNLINPNIISELFSTLIKKCTSDMPETEGVFHMIAQGYIFQYQNADCQTYLVYPSEKGQLQVEACGNAFNFRGFSLQAYEFKTPMHLVTVTGKSNKNFLEVLQRFTQGENVSRWRELLTIYFTYYANETLSLSVTPLFASNNSVAIAAYTPSTPIPDESDLLARFSHEFKAEHDKYMKLLEVSDASDELDKILHAVVGTVKSLYFRKGEANGELLGCLQSISASWEYLIVRAESCSDGKERYSHLIELFKSQLLTLSSFSEMPQVLRVLRDVDTFYAQLVDFDVIQCAGKLDAPLQPLQVLLLSVSHAYCDNKSLDILCNSSLQYLLSEAGCSWYSALIVTFSRVSTKETDAIRLVKALFELTQQQRKIENLLSKHTENETTDFVAEIKQLLLLVHDKISTDVAAKTPGDVFKALTKSRDLLRSIHEGVGKTLYHRDTQQFKKALGPFRGKPRFSFNFGRKPEAIPTAIASVSQCAFH